MAAEPFTPRRAHRAGPTDSRGRSRSSPIDDASLDARLGLRGLVRAAARRRRLDRASVGTRPGPKGPLVTLEGVDDDRRGPGPCRAASCSRAPSDLPEDWEAALPRTTRRVSR